MRNIEEHINQHLMILAQADTEKPRAKAYAQQLGKLMNEVKAFEQRLMQQMQERMQQEIAALLEGVRLYADLLEAVLSRVREFVKRYS